MKSIRTILYSTTAVLAAVSCQKSINTTNCIETNSKTVDICVNGLIPEYSASDATKSGLVNTVRVSWSGGETVYVYDGTQYLGSLVASLDGIDNRYAKLSTDETHTVKEPAAGTKKLTLLYSPLLTAAPAVAGGKIEISLEFQHTPTTPFVVFATLDYTGTDIKNTVVPFQFATSVIKVSCTGLNANTAIDKVVLDNVNSVCGLELKSDAAPIVYGAGNDSGSRAILLTDNSDFAADKVNDRGEVVFQIAVPVLDETIYSRFLTVSQGKTEFKDGKFSKKGISAAISVNTVCQLEKQITYPADAIHGKFSISEYGSQVCFAKGNLKYTKTSGQDDWSVGIWGFFDYQDECDPGSNKTYHPFYISLFNWGYDKTNSICPYITENFNSDQFYPGHKFADSEDWGCKIGDGKTWRTLTTAEWKYLLNLDGQSGRPDQKRFALCKVDGYCGLLIFPDGWDFWRRSLGDEPTYNGKTLEACGNKTYNQFQIEGMGMYGVVFLPGAGARHGTSVVDRGLGIYWTSTCGTNDGNTYWADLLSFSETSIVHGSGFRNDGFSVRLAADL